MAYFNLPNPEQTAYFSPLASHDPHEGRTTGHSHYSHDYTYNAPPTPSFAGSRESHEMVPSPGGGFTPDGLQTRYSSLSRGLQHGLGRNYRASNQRWRLLAQITARLIISLAACAGLIVAFRFYHDKRVLSRTEKRVFNAIYVGLSLILSMNIISSFKAMAGVMRWKILAGGRYRLREVDLILHLSSFQKVLELMRISVGRAFLCLACFAWILLGIAVQIGVALLGLSYNMESEGIVLLTDGPVNITDMSKIYPAYYDDPQPPSLSVQESTAHLYGDIATYFPWGVPGTPDYDDDYTYLELLGGEDGTEWSYHFRETYWVQKSERAVILTTKTDRSVTVTPHCIYYPIVEGQYAGVFDSNVTIAMEDRNVTIDWMQDWGAAGTTYVNPEEYGFVNLCGPRCSRIYIFQWVDETWDPPSDTGSFFNCTVTVSQVRNADPLQPYHSMPNLTAEMAAGAIGLDGYIDQSSRQFVRYTSASTWGTRMRNSTQLAERLLGMYATGVIAAYDMYGPSVEAMGLQSRPGVSLSVNWLYVSRNEWAFFLDSDEFARAMQSLTLGCILGAQVACGLFVLCSANSVICKDDSYLSTARLLRPLVERLGNSGSTSTGFEISQTFPNSVRYGVRSDRSTGQPVHHLDVGEDIEKLPKFPEGYYN
ncbi:unnamed protein product [Tuber aestivum]|uniref:Uncharacterized protein n=1 Tax=Tuber aestivum TaxID=59557 RepID=A0A292Q208_9PEZI|nr:unnamed protein product [Tuber aestivum]